MEAGIISIVPIIITLVFAIWSRNIIFSLFLGTLCGVLLINGPNPFTGLSVLIDTYLLGQVSKSYNASILILVAFIAGLVGLMENSGGARAFASTMTRHISSRIRAQLAVWASGALIFFTDTGSPLIIGPIFRPITDALKISRAKLAWIIDSTASPIAVLIPFLAWGLYAQGLIANEFNGLAINKSAMLVYIEAIPFQFYTILSVAMVPLIAVTRSDFGPMKKAEEAAKQGLDYVDVKLHSANDNSNLNNDKAKPNMVWLPLSVMIFVMIALLIPHGLPMNMEKIPSRVFISSLSTGYICAAVVLIFQMAFYKIRNLSEGFSLYIHSISKIMHVLIILVLAWALGAIGKDLGAPAFVASMVDGTLSPFLIPVTAFLIGAVISFATGSSWGTYAILFPIIIPISHQFDVSMAVSIGAVLSGGMFGDHCSPLSDTTILSAAGADCDPLLHVKTQLPYASLVGVCSLVAFVIAGLTNSIWSLAVGAVLLVSALMVIKYWTKHRDQETD